MKNCPECGKLIDSDYCPDCKEGDDCFTLTPKGMALTSKLPPPASSQKQETISDGFGSTVSAYCRTCGKKTMAFYRPGDARCPECYGK